MIERVEGREGGGSRGWRVKRGRVERVGGVKGVGGQEDLGLRGFGVEKITNIFTTIINTTMNTNTMTTSTTTIIIKATAITITTMTTMNAILSHAMNKKIRRNRSLV